MVAGPLEGASPGQLPSPTSSQELTLAHAIELARQQTRGILRARADVLLVDVAKVEALSAVKPRVDLSLSAYERFESNTVTEYRNTRTICPSTIEGEQIDCETAGFGKYDSVIGTGPYLERLNLGNNSQPYFLAQLRVRQLVFDGGRWWGRIDWVDDLKSQRKNTLQAIENNLRLQVVQSYYAYQKSFRSVSAFEEQVTKGEEQLKEAKELLKEGKRKASQVATAERNLAADRLNLARRRFSLGRTKRRLNLSIGRDAQHPVVISQTLPDVEPLRRLHVPKLPWARRLAARYRPELQASVAVLNRYQRELSMSYANYWPQISIEANYTRASRKIERVFSDPLEHYTASIGLLLNWNLFEGFANNARVRRAELNLNKVEADYQDLKRRVFAEVADRLQNLNLQLQVYALATSALGSAREAVRLTRENFSSGQASALELRDAEQAYTSAQLQTFNASIDVAIAQEQLRKAVGVNPLSPVGRQGREGRAEGKDAATFGGGRALPNPEP